MYKSFTGWVKSGVWVKLASTKKPQPKNHIHTMPKKNKKTRKFKKECRRKIKQIGTTTNCLSSQSGLAPFVNFINGTGICDELAQVFKDLRKSKKGIELEEAFLQLVLFFADGRESSLKTFDTLKENEAWQKLLGCKVALGTAALKRLLHKAYTIDVEAIRPLIRRIFLSALKAKNPKKVILFLDSSVYDNDGAKCRAGVKCTYKKKEGYHPINLIWDGMYIDTYFQSGHCSTNHDGVAIKMLQEIVPMIREHLGEDIQIIVRMDGGYYDQKIFTACDALKINFICAGKRYSDHKIHASRKLEGFDGVYRKKACTWHYLTFQERRKSWPEEMAYRALFLRPTEEDGEALLGLESRIILTNLDVKSCSDQEIIDYDHSRGADELTHRAAKDFASERMPCLDFHANALWYSMGIVSFNLFQIFKRNIAGFSWNCYPTTVRRKLFDLAGKIINKGRSLTLKITSWKMKELKFDQIWEKSLTPWVLPVL